MNLHQHHWLVLLSQSVIVGGGVLREWCHECDEFHVIGTDDLGRWH